MTMKSGKILVVDDDQKNVRILKAFLEAEGYETFGTYNAIDALDYMKSHNVDLLLVDIVMPYMNGIELCQKIKSYPDTQHIPVILVTALNRKEERLKGIHVGADEFISKPVDDSELSARVGSLLKMKFQHDSLIEHNKNLEKLISKTKDLEEQNINLIKNLQNSYDFENIIGKSSSMKKLYKTMKLVCEKDVNVLIYGESGTGKELIARSIHYNSTRKNNRFVPVFCSVLPHNLFESELFGHIKGSFTGAVSNKTGLLETANNGTLFLDEISEIPLDMQVKLLRFIQEKKIRPVGSNKEKAIDIRIISATNKNLMTEIDKGSFRDDLYYRLNVVPINIPPLKERREDIPLLFNHFLIKQENLPKDGIPKKVDKKVFDVLMDYDWPGNVRQLENFVSRMVALNRGDILTVDDIPQEILTRNDEFVNDNSRRSFSTKAIERKLSINEYIQYFILEYQDVYTDTKIAELLGISRKNLWEKRKKFNLIKE